MISTGLPPTRKMGVPAPRRRRRARAVSAVIAAISLATMVPTPAMALEVVIGEVTTSLSPSSIDPSKPVKVTIQKRVSDQSVTPVGGITYWAIPIPNIDVTTVEGRNAVRDITEETVETLVDNARNNKAYETATTDDNGKAVFPGLTPGAYVINELIPLGASPDYRVAEPFVTVLPFPNKDGNAWEYNVTVEPKTVPVSDVRPNPPSTTTPPSPSRPPGSSLIPFLPLIPVLVIPPGPPPAAPAPPPAAPPTTVPAPSPTPTKGIPKIRLAKTGANVLGVAGIGLLIVILGAILVAAKRRKRGEPASDAVAGSQPPPNVV